MLLIKKFWFATLLVLLLVSMTASSIYGQVEHPLEQREDLNQPLPATEPGENETPDIQTQDLFQWPLPLESSETSEAKKAISESTFVEEAPPATPKEGRLDGPGIKDLPPVSPQKKRTVQVPVFQKKPFVDAGDFRDPFFFVRGFQENSPQVLQPGVTVDGLQFFSYADSNKFMENFYPTPTSPWTKFLRTSCNWNPARDVCIAIGALKKSVQTISSDAPNAMAATAEPKLSPRHTRIWWPTPRTWTTPRNFAENATPSRLKWSSSPP